MDELIKAVGVLLVECGDSGRIIDAGTDYEGDPLRQKAETVAALLPRMADRQKADQAAVLLLAAGSKLRMDGSAEATAAWDAAERQALALLGVVPLTPAA